MNLGHLQLLDNRAEEIKLFETSIKEKARSVGKLEILEAGCGRRCTGSHPSEPDGQTHPLYE